MKEIRQNSERHNINWFPGHMARAKRQISEDIKKVDAVAEVTDARIPLSSRNPDILGVISGRPHLIVLNKSDLADARFTEEWVRYYRRENIAAISVDCRSNKAADSFIKGIKSIMKEKIDKWRLKGMVGRPIKVMITGTPNTGKSTLINRLSKRSGAKSENRPGVTRGDQWITMDKNMELLDTPGILPPKISSEISQQNLAFVGSIRDEVIDIGDVSLKLLKFLCDNYPDRLSERYKISIDRGETIDPYSMMEAIGRSRGFLASGGASDFERTAKMILTEFRSGKLGRITLETVADTEIKNK